MKEFFKKDSTRRVLWTILEGFLGGLFITLSSASNYDEALIKSAIVAGVAGSISAVKNLIVNHLEKKESEEYGNGNSY